METWSIQIHKDYLKFSSAHFLIFPDGSAERLHGHNYKVFVEVESALDRFGLVLNFKEIKPLIRAIVDELDERLLLPGRHPELAIVTRDGGMTEVRYRQRHYLIPTDEILVLPVNNTSAENLAGVVGQRLAQRLSEQYPGVELRRLSVGVEETPGQQGVWVRDESQQRS